jgi:hypothetical protein
MALRDRQLGGLPLTWGVAFITTLLAACAIPFIAEYFWFRVFPFVPETVRPWLVYVGVLLYISQCAGNVKAGTEQAQLCFGIYTGVSFSAGFYLLPKLPFPIISLLLRGVFDYKVYQYLGWVLEGEVRVESIAVSFASQGLTDDGVRVSLSGTLVFEIENAAVYLSQTRDGTDRSVILEALTSETSARIKKRVIANHTAKQLYQGAYSGGEDLTEWVTEACSFVKDFGLSLSRAPIVRAEIESERIRKAFDADNAKALLRRNTDEVAEAFSEFKKGLPLGTSDEVAFMLFNAARLDENLPAVTMSNIKVK